MMCNVSIVNPSLINLRSVTELSLCHKLKLNANFNGVKLRDFKLRSFDLTQFLGVNWVAKILGLQNKSLREWINSFDIYEKNNHLGGQEVKTEKMEQVNILDDLKVV